MNRKHDERGQVTRLLMVISLIVLASLTLSGCLVSEKKYKAAVADMESAKIDLEKSRMMRPLTYQPLHFEPESAERVFSESASHNPFTFFPEGLLAWSNLDQD